MSPQRNLVPVLPSVSHDSQAIAYGHWPQVAEEGAPVMTPGYILPRLALLLWVAYCACWAAGLIAWWIVLLYSIVVTVAWAEGGEREQS
jgi:hypothetical protein